MSIDPSRRRLLLAAIAATAFPLSARAEEWPARSVRVIVPFAPAGATDIVARLVAERLSKRLGQPVIVENRPGGGGIVGADLVAKAAPDGYTFGHLTGSALVNLPLLNPAMPYVATRDLVPVSLVQVTEQILVAGPSFKPSNVQELVKLARTEPGKVSFAYTGAGTANHLAGVSLEYMAGISLNKVTYKGEAPVLNDVMAGHADTAVASIAAALALVQAGKLKPIASLGATRAVLLPALPTVAEQGYPKFNTGNSFQGLHAPRNTPAPILQKMSEAVREVLQEPELRQQLIARGGAPMGTTPEAYTAWLREETERSAEAIRLGKVKYEE